MKQKTLTLAILMLTVALAGCTSEDEQPQTGEDDFVDTEEYEIKAGKGAIQGIVVDDAFRPIPGALVLLQELAITRETTENGEFQILDLEPGTYTFRVEAVDHENIPRTLQVVEGEFSEITLFANRVISEGGTIITREFSVFIPCAAAFVVNGVTANCVLDLSGDSWRSSFTSNYTEQEDITYMVTEAKLNHEGNWNVQVREDDGSTAGGERYAVADIEGGDYVKIVNQLGVLNEENNDQRNNVPWNNTKEFSTNIFLNGEYNREIQDTGDQACNPSVSQTCRTYTGLGVQLGIQAKFVQTLFIGEPEVDPQSYRTMS